MKCGSYCVLAYPHDNRFDPARLPSCSAKIPVLDGTHITHILQMARVKDVVLRSVWATESYCKTFQASRLRACATKTPPGIHGPSPASCKWHMYVRPSPGTGAAKFTE